MSLRRARFDDHWRRIYRRDFGTRFTEIEIKNLIPLEDAKILFAGGLTGIVGANGVGKSTLASAIAQLLSIDPNGKNQGYRTKLTGSAIAGTAVAQNAVQQLAVEDADTATRKCTSNPFTGHYQWLDPSSFANEVLRQIEIDQSFDDLLQGVTPLKLTADELAIASYLVGKEYSEIELYEINDYGNRETFPYFRATVAGRTYGSEKMGRGELSLLLTYWTLKGLPANCILILEEPETHVSPRSQDSLMNILAKFSDEKAMWTIVTSHSPTIIRRIPIEHLKLLIRNEGLARVVNATKLHVSLLLGGGVAFRALMLVEDEAAKHFTLTILEHVDPELSRQFEIVSTSGEAGITAALRSMPSVKNWMVIVGAYDGDQRGAQPAGPLNWPTIFLPGQQAPEEILKHEMNKNKDFAEMVAKELPHDLDAVRIALNQAAGLDHHDYFHEVAAAVNLHVTVVYRAFGRIWLKDENNLESARALAEELRRILET
jgi:predicted ATPase